MYTSQLQYLIRWTGYDSLTWEPAKFVDGLQAVDEFHQQYPQKQGPLENILGGPRTSKGDTVTVRRNTDILKSRNGNLAVVWKELCYRTMETLGDAEERGGMLAYHML